MEYKVIGLAVAFVVGQAAIILIKSLVDNVIMPLITPFVPEGSWQSATFTIGPVIIGWGAFLGSLINFLIIAIVIFIIARHFIREEKEEKAKKK